MPPISVEAIPRKVHVCNFVMNCAGIINKFKAIPGALLYNRPNPVQEVQRVTENSLCLNNMMPKGNITSTEQIHETFDTGAKLDSQGPVDFRRAGPPQNTHELMGAPHPPPKHMIILKQC